MPQILRELFTKRKVISEPAEEFLVEPFNNYNWQTHTFTELPLVDRDVDLHRSNKFGPRATINFKIWPGKFSPPSRWRRVSSGCILAP